VSFSGCRRSRHPQFGVSVGSEVGKVQVGEQKYMLLMLQNVVQSRGALGTSGLWIGLKLILPDFPMLIPLFWRNYSFKVFSGINMLKLIAYQLRTLHLESKTVTSSGINRLKFAPANPLIHAKKLQSTAKILFSSSYLLNSRSSDNSSQFFGKAIRIFFTWLPDLKGIRVFEFKLLALIHL
jgi:hypothetical protein